MSFDPITGVWAANKAVQKVGGGSSSDSPVWINLADYGVDINTFFDEEFNPKTVGTATITEEQYQKFKNTLSVDNVGGCYFPCAELGGILRFSNLQHVASDDQTVMVCFALSFMTEASFQMWQIAATPVELMFVQYGLPFGGASET